MDRFQLGCWCIRPYLSRSARVLPAASSTRVGRYETSCGVDERAEDQETARKGRESCGGRALGRGREEKEELDEPFKL